MCSWMRVEPRPRAGSVRGTCERLHAAALPAGFGDRTAILRVIGAREAPTNGVGRCSEPLGQRRDSAGRPPELWHDPGNEQRPIEPIVIDLDDHRRALELGVGDDVGDAVDPADRHLLLPQDRNHLGSSAGARPRADGLVSSPDRATRPSFVSRDASASRSSPPDGLEEPSGKARGVRGDADQRIRRHTGTRWSAPSCARCFRFVRGPRRGSRTREDPLENREEGFGRRHVHDLAEARGRTLRAAR